MNPLVRCPRLAELPAPPPGRSGWPWTEETPQLPDRMPDGREWPRISIVTPSYNQGHFIEETIRSVLLQGYPNLEYFVIDGGSNDASVEIIRKYEPWLTGWISEKDRGQSDAINKGFARCTGELMTYQNSDDFFLRGAFHDVGRLRACNQDCGVIVGAFRRCDPSSRYIGAVEPAVLKLPTPRDLSLGPPGIYRLHQASTFFSRQVLDQVGRFVAEDLHYVMDRELLYRACRQSKVILALACYGAFRMHPQSKTVASVLPFAREFAELYLRHLNGNPEEDRHRRHMARHRTAVGYLKAAKGTSRVLLAAWYLTRAVAVDARLLKQPSYMGIWLRALHLRDTA